MTWLLNWLFIQGAILAFMAPFAAVYWWRHRSDIAGKPFNEALEYFFSSPQVHWLVFAWAALEALVWWVIPEYLLLLVVFMRLRNKVKLLWFDILGTAAGTLVAFMLPRPSDEAILRIPYLQPGMLEQTRVWYDQLGMLGLLFQPFSGVPYKVFTLTSHDYGFFLPLFLVLAIAVRISRYYLFYVIFKAIYPLLHRHVFRNYVPLFFIAGLIFSLGLVRVSNSYGPGYQVDYSSGETVQRWLHIK